MFSYTDPVTGKKKFVYSWKLERNDKTPTGKKWTYRCVKKKS